MEDGPRFRPLYPVGERKPDPKVWFMPRDSELARKREDALRSRGTFVAKPPRAPEKCPFCGTLASEYREECGQELLLPGGNPFICAKCGNREWNY